VQQLFKTLSQLLSSGRSTVTADEMVDLPEQASAILLNQRILVPAKSSTHVTCDACHNDHVEEVNRIKGINGKVFFRIRCPDAGWVEVPADRLRQWTVDPGKLISLLSNCLGPSQIAEEAIPGIAWRIGTVEIAGNTYCVVFVRGGDFSPPSILNDLAQKFSPASTIVIGTGAFPDHAVKFAATTNLHLAFVVAGDNFEFQPTHIRSILATEAPAAGNVFQLRGEFWQLSFDGKTVFVKDSVGLGYIARLLMEPGRDIPAVTLLAARAGIDPLVATGSSGEMLDVEARGKYAERYRELTAELQEAKENEDLGQIEKFENEMDQLAGELDRSFGLGGRSRQSSDIQKVRNAVSMAVSRTRDKIAEQHDPLGKHLLTAISSGVVFRYSPEREIDWLT
jgi:hypothetical protein